MSAADQLVDVAANFVPGVNNVRWAAKIIAVLVLIAIVGFALWWFLIRPAGLKREAEQAKVEKNLAGAGTTAATAALGEIRVHDRETTIIRETVKEGENAVRSAAGADVAAPPVAAALHDALCGMRTYQSEPDCAALQADHRRVGPALPDVGSFTPGE